MALTALRYTIWSRGGGGRPTGNRKETWYEGGLWAVKTVIGLGRDPVDDGQTLDTQLPDTGNGEIALGAEWKGLNSTTGTDIIPTECTCTSDQESEYIVKSEGVTWRQDSGKRFKLCRSIFGQDGPG